MPLRPGSGGIPRPLAYGGSRHSPKSLLRRAQPAVFAGQEFSRDELAGGAPGVPGPLWLACRLHAAGTGRRGSFSRGWQQRTAACWADHSRALGPASELEQAVEEAAHDSRNGAAESPRLQPPAPRSFDRPARGSRTVTTDRLLLILIPAYNEEAAVGSVIEA